MKLVLDFLTFCETYRDSIPLLILQWILEPVILPRAHLSSMLCLQVLHVFLVCFLLCDYLCVHELCDSQSICLQHSSLFLFKSIFLASLSDQQGDGHTFLRCHLPALSLLLFLSLARLMTQKMFRLHLQSLPHLISHRNSTEHQSASFQWWPWQGIYLCDQ